MYENPLVEQVSTLILMAFGAGLSVAVTMFLMFWAISAALSILDRSS